MEHFPGINTRTFGRKHTWINDEAKITPNMTFKEAVEAWMRIKSPLGTDGKPLGGYIRKNTERDYRSKLGSIALFFGNTKLGDIHGFHMRAYQQARVAGDPIFTRKRRPHEEPSCRPVKPQQVNQEMQLLIALLKKARVWRDEFRQDYEPLKEEISEMARALTPAEQQRWLDTARSNPRWNLIFWWSLLTFDTCMSTNEIRALRLGDLNLQQQILTVPPEGSKNRYRQRTIPIVSADALWALDQLVRRANSLGAILPQHYLFPFKITQSKEAFPDRHMTESGIKKLWEEVRDASGLTWFRPYDTRHTAITRLAEAGVPISVIMKRAGHVSPQMTEHYTHISDQTQVDSVRKAQRYNGGLGTRPGFPYSQPSVQYAPPPPQPTASVDPAALIVQLLQQCGVTAEQLRDALIAQTTPSSTPGPPSNVIGFRSR
jgi:integrase